MWWDGVHACGGLRLNLGVRLKFRVNVLELELGIVGEMKPDYWNWTPGLSTYNHTYADQLQGGSSYSDTYLHQGQG